MDHVQNLVNILEEHMNYKQMLMDLEYIEVKLNKKNIEINLSSFRTFTIMNI